MPPVDADNADLSAIPIRVLIVDDDETHAHAVGDALKRINCDCTVAGSGQRGGTALFCGNPVSSRASRVVSRFGAR